MKSESESSSANWVNHSAWRLVAMVEAYLGALRSTHHFLYMHEYIVFVQNKNEPTFCIGRRIRGARGRHGGKRQMKVGANSATFASRTQSDRVIVFGVRVAITTKIDAITPAAEVAGSCRHDDEVQQKK